MPPAPAPPRPSPRSHTTATRHRRFYLRYYEQQSLVSILPSSGPVDGETSILISFSILSAGGGRSDATFYCRFGDLLRTGIRIKDGQLACPSPAVTTPRTSTLSISSNAQQFSNIHNFSYYADPVVSAICPSSGPIDAGTAIIVSGEAFAPGAHCRYGETPGHLMEATYLAGPPAVLTCGSIRLDAPATLRFEVSLNAQQFTADKHSFNFYSPPSIKSMCPNGGPVAGDTAVRLAGTGFSGGTHNICRFDDAGAVLRVPATYRSRTASACLTPPVGSVRAVWVVVRLSLNGQQFSDQLSTTFVFYGVLRVSSFSPSSGPAAGVTLVTVAGAHFGNGSDYRCRFGELSTVAASFVLGAGVLTCIAPTAVTNGSFAVPLEITHNGQQYTADGTDYAFYGVPAISHVNPVGGPTAGLTFVSVYGHALEFGSEYRCRIGGVGSIFASLVSFSRVACLSPEATGVLSVSISLNGQQYVELNQPNFTFYASSSVTRLSPSSGPVRGSTVVTVTGTNFASFVEHPVRCRFGGTWATAMLIDDVTLECRSPPASTAGLAFFAHTDFDKPSAVPGELFGHAAYSGGALVLTPAEMFMTGSFVLRVARVCACFPAAPRPPPSSSPRALSNPRVASLHPALMSSSRRNAACLSCHLPASRTSLSLASSGSYAASPFLPQRCSPPSPTRYPPPSQPHTIASDAFPSTPTSSTHVPPHPLPSSG